MKEIKAFKTSDGNIFESIKDAQNHELKEVVKRDFLSLLKKHPLTGSEMIGSFTEKEQEFLFNFIINFRKPIYKFLDIYIHDLEEISYPY